MGSLSTQSFPHHSHPTSSGFRFVRGKATCRAFPSQPQRALEKELGLGSSGFQRAG